MNVPLRRKSHQKLTDMMLVAQMVVIELKR